MRLDWFGFLQRKLKLINHWSFFVIQISERMNFSVKKLNLEMEKISGAFKGLITTQVVGKLLPVHINVDNHAV